MKKWFFIAVLANSQLLMATVEEAELVKARVIQHIECMHFTAANTTAYANLLDQIANLPKKSKDRKKQKKQFLNDITGFAGASGMVIERSIMGEMELLKETQGCYFLRTIIEDVL